MFKITTKPRSNSSRRWMFFAICVAALAPQVFAAPKERATFIKGNVNTKTSLKTSLGETIGVLSQRQFQKYRVFSADENLNRPASQNSASLLVEMPESLLSQNYIFGGVVTRVIDPKLDENLGMLKISGFPEALARLSYDASNQVINIYTCKNPCREQSVYEPSFHLPVLSRNVASKTLTVDFSRMEKDFDLLNKMVGIGELPNEFERLSFSVSGVDYSYDTLIIETQNEYLRRDEDPHKIRTHTRWYLKLTSSFDPNFVSRKATDGVGFFMTNYQSTDAHVTRFSNSKPVKYYIKNVPQKYLKAFSDAIEDWNIQAAGTLGRKFIEYEVLNKSDSRFDQIVAGDIRYNVIEWDLETSAPYGGFGPSFAHPNTGEIFSAVTLIQGPRIEEIYTNWYKLPATPNAQALRSFKASTRFETPIQRWRRVTSRRDLNLPSFEVELFDSAFKRDEFDLPPEGYSYEDYMYGYFREMVAHEIGHNLGLRHNFKGNVDTDTELSEGKVSHSVMEYLGRGFRYLNRVASYDVMAIGYGYMGFAPQRLDMYCTDENGFNAAAPGNSAECSSDDATVDPYSYFENRLAKVYTLITNGESQTAPNWKTSELVSVVPTALEGVLSYAISAPATADSWILFFRNADRPRDAYEIPGYVLNRLNHIVCNPDEAKFILSKTDAAAKKLVEDNLKQFKSAIWKIAQDYNRPYPVITTDQFQCLRGL